MRTGIAFQNGKNEEDRQVQNVIKDYQLKIAKLTERVAVKNNAIVIDTGTSSEEIQNKVDNILKDGYVVAEIVNITGNKTLVVFGR